MQIARLEELGESRALFVQELRAITPLAGELPVIE